MAGKSEGMATAHPATVRIVNGPVPDDDPSHALRLAAAKDLVQRAKAQLKKAEADLARLIKEQKEN